MKVITKKTELRSWVQKDGGARVLVPTMGALHAGHLSLLDRAREQAGPKGSVFVSIFVNPVQFGPHEDYDSYPRPLEADLAACEARGCDLVFAPDAREMYAGDASVLVRESSLSQGLCGSSRPGHFDGVCTVVAKLFLLAKPQAAVFGEKDYQQLAVINRMVRDLDFPVEIIASPTVREKDGLAMSSRNAYLDEKERAAAPVIHRALCFGRDKILRFGKSGDLSPGEVLAEMVQMIEQEPLARIDYLKIVHPQSLKPLEGFGEEGFRIIAAVFFGKTRLIDNVGAEGAAGA